MSTSNPTLSVKIAKDLSTVGCKTLDAPVSGGDVGAIEAKLSIMVGGDRATYEKFLPLFLCMAETEKGGRISYMGGPGAGQHTKIANQILIATNMIGVCEALLYAYKAGHCDVEKVLEAISSGAAGSWSLSNLAPRIIRRDFKPGFSVDHFIKDMEIALKEARRMHLSLPGLALAHELYSTLKAQGGGLMGTQALVLALETLNGMKTDSSGTR